MSVDMTKWQEIAKKNIHNRPAGEGRLAGKITIVTGAAQGFGKGIAEDGLPGALEVAAALRSLVSLLRGAGRGAVLSVVSAIEADARTDADRLIRGEAPNSGAEDDPAGAVANAMDNLAYALLRFEARRLMLETLGATVALRDVVYQSRRLTRHALRRAGRPWTVSAPTAASRRCMPASPRSPRWTGCSSSLCGTWTTRRSTGRRPTPSSNPPTARR